MAPQYKPSDDGSVVGGRIVVYMAGVQTTALVVRSSKAELGKATAAMLHSAAADGTALCEECEEARRKLQELMELRR